MRKRRFRHEKKSTAKTVDFVIYILFRLIHGFFLQRFPFTAMCHSFLHKIFRFYRGFFGHTTGLKNIAALPQFYFLFDGLFVVLLFVPRVLFHVLQYARKHSFEHVADSVVRALFHSVRVGYFLAAE